MIFRWLNMAGLSLVLVAILVFVNGRAQGVDKTQQNLYPYGTDKGDSNLPKGDDEVSGAITFDNGLPFGSEKFNDIYVATNGIISLGSPVRYSYWEGLSSSSNSGRRIISPYMTDLDASNNGEVLYQLYKKSTNPSSPVLQRAASDLLDNFGVTGYNPTIVLVATWVDVESRGYSGQVQSGGTCTFQAVVITNGLSTYIIFLYKAGEFNPPAIGNYRISVGYASDSDIEEFVPPTSYLVFSLDTVIGNTGRYGTWMALVGNISNPDQMCENFYLANKYLINNANFQEAAADLLECPCSISQMGRQWSFELSDRYRECYALSHLATKFNHDHNKLCCYTRSGSILSYISDPPEAGFITRYNPMTGSDTIRQSYLNDIVPHRWCCRESTQPKMCQLFYSVRPRHNCSTTPIINAGGALGDPHFTTFDGKKYTFNGLGEFIMATIPDKDFMFQARTSRVTLENRTMADATVFSAIAVKESDYAHFQVELSADKQSMVIYANGQDLTGAFNSLAQFSWSQEDSISIQIFTVNGSHRVDAVFPSGFEIAVSPGIESLDFGVNMMRTMEGMTSGLLGNFNGNPDDDFQLPDGSKLSGDLTEREIFEQFGQKWAVTQQNSVFTYPAGESAANYSHPDFRPMFKEDFDPALVQAAETFCGQDNSACVFDYIVTKSEEFARNTKSLDQEVDNDRVTLTNRNPSIRLVTPTDTEGRIEVTENQPITVRVSATDPDGDTLTYVLVGTPAGVTISNTGEITYTPQLNVPVSINVVAVDNKNGRSAALHIPLVMCTLCSNHGQCDKSRVRPAVQQGGIIQKYVCQCRPAWTGAECQSDFDACADSPCSEGQTCTDTTAAAQETGSAPYTCGACPSGTQQDVDGKCADIDECSQTNNCSQMCTNTYRSYQCSCDPGYRLSQMDMATCNDINECAEKSHRCQQKCVNAMGTYTCACEEGYTLQSDQRTCALTVSTSPCTNSGCEQVCVVDDTGNPQCRCQAFYQISSQDSSKCVDVDECALANQPCDQVCSNTVGGYQCSCHPGFSLADDMTTCIPCESEYYGVNCSQTCMCGSQSNGCDPVRGCICKSGYTGPRCNININECEQTDVCSLDKVCHDTDGSFECRCPDGYFTSVRGTCFDLSECIDLTTHNCNASQHQVCRNTAGSYSCECEDGFYKDANGNCQDIDECVDRTHECQQKCVNTRGGYSCQCYFGYRLDNTDRTKCVLSENVCGSVGLTCDHGCTVNMDTQQAFCYCNSGYTLDTNGQTCIDINECNSATLNRCSHKDTCVNAQGSYLCTCPAGYKLENDQRTCTACTGGTWGINCANSCGCSTTGTVRCDAATGCVCKPGVTGRFCATDIDECTTLQSPCQSFEACVNTLGSYMCGCQTGYEASSTGACEDINECLDPALHSCDQNCINTPGGHRCTCYPGFTRSATQQKCIDVNECEVGTHKCSQDCTNTIGSYRCSCKEGFELADDGVTCTATTVCTTKACAHGCSNITGQETCYCPRGQMVNETNELQCVDIDLCQSSPCQEDCQETKDGTDFMCNCSIGYELAGDGISCQACDAGTYGVACSGTCNCVNSNTLTDICSTMDGTCMCQSGWTGEDCGQDVDECSASASPCSGANSKCVNSAGSYMCDCKDGYIKRTNVFGVSTCLACEDNFYGPGCAMSCQCNPQTSSCNKVNGICTCDQGWTGPTCETDVDECQQNIHNCGSYTPPAICLNEPGSYTCQCPKGYKIAGSQKCEDINECTTNNPCNTMTATCQNSVGSYTCTCKAGYVKNVAGNCVDINECVSTNPCAADQQCQNTEGNYSCQCRTGFNQTSAGACVDINECTSTQTPCAIDEQCFNTEGSYSCGCQPGYQKDASGNCVDKNECTTNNACNAMTETCQNSVGSYTCTCKTGYQKNQAGNCVDINECSQNTAACSSTQVCFNTVGSYMCNCRTGYRKDASNNCVDINECASSNPCAANQQCQNTVGSYTCQCRTGYEQNSAGACVDINECANAQSPCVNGDQCFNSPGSYSCGCQPGYQKDASGNCVDTNECTTNNPCNTMTETCQNSVGSYTCTCKIGYQKNLAGNCVDMNECLPNNPCPSGQSCRPTNTAGSYTCSCPAGYMWHQQQGGCVDIDECAAVPNLCPQSCTNTVGSYTCSCLDGYRLNAAGNRCVALFTSTFELVFPSFQPTNEMLMEGSQEYVALVTEIKDSVKEQLQKLISGFLDIVIKGLRRGSLIVVVEVIVDKETSTNAAGEVTNAMIKVDAMQVTVNGMKQPDGVLRIIIAVSGNSDQCEVRKQVSPCADDEMCVENSNGLTECRVEQDDDGGDNTDMYIGIGIGVGVAIILIVIIIVMVRFRLRKKSKGITVN